MKRVTVFLAIVFSLPTLAFREQDGRLPNNFIIPENSASAYQRMVAAGKNSVRNMCMGKEGHADGPVYLTIPELIGKLPADTQSHIAVEAASGKTNHWISVAHKQEKAFLECVTQKVDIAGATKTITDLSSILSACYDEVRFD